jgi:hypothetical protein
MEPIKEIQGQAHSLVCIHQERVEMTDDTLVYYDTEITKVVKGFYSTGPGCQFIDGVNK